MIKYRGELDSDFRFSDQRYPGEVIQTTQHVYSGMELLFDEKELFGRDTSSSIAKWSIPVLISICLKIKTITDQIP